MILERGDMWTVFDSADLWLFTGNSYINQCGELVMGRGLALEVKIRYPELPRIFGNRVQNTCGHLGDAGVVLAYGDAQTIGMFQVKYNFKDRAKLMLIGKSCVELCGIIKGWRRENVHLNFPGIGYGGLDRMQVLPIISELPDVVHVWERGRSKGVTA